MKLLGGLGGNRHERAGYELYNAAVAAARQPFFYAELGVPDTVDGRFDLIGLHAFLFIRHLRSLPPPGPAVAQALFDAMFHDMDINLRELGVGDLSVGKKVRVMWEAFHGRASVYEAALATGDAGALAQALERNVWRGKGAAGSAPARLVEVVRTRDAEVARHTLDQILSGQVTFYAAEGKTI